MIYSAEVVPVGERRNEMRNSSFQTIRLMSVMLVAASLIFSLTVRIPVTLAEEMPHSSGQPSISDPLPTTEKPASDETLAGGDPAMQTRVERAYGQLPLSFEANRGQTDREVKFISRGAGYALFLTSTEAVLTFRTADNESRDDENPQSAIRNPQLAVLRMKLAGANPAPQIVGEDQLPGHSNYLKGNDPQKWQQDVPLYARVRYEEVYDGVDMLYYGNQQQLEYDFRLAPFADPQEIALNFEGADSLSLDGEGNLVLRTRAGEVIQHAPTIYQEVEGTRRTVSGRYILRKRNQVGFEVAAYDHSRPLVIDPVVQFSTFLGGNQNDFGNDIAVDAKGNAYVAGSTNSADFPKQNPIDGVLEDDSDAFVTKFATDGSALVYSTFLGGQFSDSAAAIAVTQDGKACITGFTGENSAPPIVQNSFPVTPNAFQNAGRTNVRKLDAYVTVLNANGDGFIYSTFYGGSKSSNSPDANDFGNDIAVDSTGKVYIAGASASNNLPMKNGFQTTRAGDKDGFIAKFNPLAATGPASFLYASFLGGTGEDFALSIALDNADVAYVAGETESDDFPTKSPVAQPPFQQNRAGNDDGFVTKINPAQTGANSLIYSTYLGGNDFDDAEDIAVDSQKRAYIIGSTVSSDFPLKNPFDSTFVGEREAYVTKLDTNGTALFYSSFLGGNGSDFGEDIAVDAQGNAFLTGNIDSATGFPLLNAFQPNFGGGEQDAFITKISAANSPNVSPQILFSSFLGGSGNDFGNEIALGPKKSIFLVGNTSSTNFPTTPGAFQKNAPAELNAFVTKIAEVNDDTIGTFRPSDLTFRLRNSNTAGPPDLTVGPAGFQPGDLPVVGDFNGDSKDTTGVFRNGTFRLSNNANGSAPFSVLFGQAGDLPLAGDWDGDGNDTIGVFRPSEGKFLLRNSNTAGSPDITLIFLGGTAGDTPLVGDWDGDGDDTIGVYNNSQHKFFLRNKFNALNDIVVTFGIAGDVPLTGDWDGDGDDTIGLFRNSQHKFFLRNVNNVANNIQVDFGATGDTPLAGDWDGLSSSTPPNSGVNEPAAGSSRAGEAQLFTTTCSDPDGWRNIHTIDFKISKPGPSGTGEIIALWAQFDQNRQVMRLYNPDTRRWEEGAPGANRILENRFVRLRLGGAMVDGSGPAGPSVQLTWNVVFEDAAVMDGYKQYLRIEDDAGFSTGFDEVGSWSVTP